ncbi:hypothetical protein C5167_015950 [Papaver somniferum]|nr:hypothetical protein C5167_015950 [Papaver somniferum]
MMNTVEVDHLYFDYVFLHNTYSKFNQDIDFWNFSPSSFLRLLYLELGSKFLCLITMEDIVDGVTNLNINDSQESDYSL